MPDLTKMPPGELVTRLIETAEDYGELRHSKDMVTATGARTKEERLAKRNEYRDEILRRLKTKQAK